MDYRAWTDRDDWTKFNEPPLKEIDQAVEWGGKYGIHVLINFHRTPGYTVASPPEAKSLWTDAEAQRVCALHWAMFARRYKGVPNERLSFNLFNEPANIEPAVYWGTLYQPGKSDLSEEARRPLVVELPSASNVSMRVRVAVVSSRAVLVARADGKVVWQKEFACGPGEGEWKKAVHQPQWNSYQNVYDRDYEFPLPDGARRVELAVTAGDWLRLSEIGIKIGSAQEHVLP